MTFPALLAAVNKSLSETSDLICRHVPLELRIRKVNQSLFSNVVRFAAYQRLQVFRPSWDLLLLARCKGNAAHPNKQTSVRKSSPDWQIGPS